MSSESRGLVRRGGRIAVNSPRSHRGEVSSLCRVSPLQLSRFFGSGSFPENEKEWYHGRGFVS